MNLRVNTMTVKELQSVLVELPEDFPVKVILDGKIDSKPEWNVCDDALYIEGIVEKE